MFCDGVTTGEDHFQFASRVNFNALDHLTNCVVIIFGGAVLKLIDGGLQAQDTFLTFTLRLTCCSDCFQPCFKLGDFLRDSLEAFF